MRQTYQEWLAGQQSRICRGMRGGIARAAKLSPERRREIAKLAARARWSDRNGSDPSPDSIPAKSNSEYDHFMKYLDIPSNSKIDSACRFLERQGQSFLVDFGLDNAIDKMLEITGEQWGLQ